MTDSSVVSEKVWRFVLARDNYRCLNCYTDEELQPAHYTHRSLGGEDDPEDIMTLCNDCHRKHHAHKLKVERIYNLPDLQPYKFFFREIR